MTTLQIFFLGGIALILAVVLWLDWIVSEKPRLDRMADEVAQRRVDGSL